MTPKQERFVQEYMVDLNATQAAIRAGYSSKGAEVQGAKLLRNAKVQTAIEKAKEDLRVATGVTIEYVIRRLQEESELYGEGSSHGARIKALELLGKHLNIFTERSELSGPNGTPLNPPQLVVNFVKAHHDDTD